MRAAYDVIIDGVSVGDSYGLTLTDDTDLGVAEPKTYTVDIPGGNGVIDLTTALTGDVVFKTRKMKLVFASDDAGDVSKLRRRITSAIHGRRLKFVLGFEPEYTYTGRFSVEIEPSGVAGAKVTMTVTADPYKKKETCLYSLNCAGGRTFTLWSGRRPVHPTIECAAACRVEFGGKSVNVPAGIFVIRDVLFTEGPNDIYIESNTLTNVTWAALGEGGANASKWSDLASYTWADLQRIGAEQIANTYSWRDVAKYTWTDLASKTWDGLNYKSAAASAGEIDDEPVYISYDWEDL